MKSDQIYMYSNVILSPSKRSERKESRLKINSLFFGINLGILSPTVKTVLLRLMLLLLLLTMLMISVQWISPVFANFLDNPLNDSLVVILSEKFFHINIITLLKSQRCLNREGLKKTLSRLSRILITSMDKKTVFKSKCRKKEIYIWNLNPSLETSEILTSIRL